MKKVLVVGSKGMAGHMIRQVLIDAKSFEVIDIARDEHFFKPTYLLDIRNVSLFEKILIDEAPDVVINCVGVLNEDAAANPDTSIFINSFIPHFLAQRCKRLIHISTDCVFSGQRGNYLENDLKDGRGFYAESKALGEVLYAPHLTVRTSIIGPDLNTNGKGLLNWFLNQKKSIKGYSNAFWSGVTTFQLANVILELLTDSKITGLIHLTNNTKISKFHLLKLIGEISKSEVTINKFEDYHVDKSLINTREDIQFRIPDYETMIIDLFDFMEQYKSSYYSSYYSK